MEVKPLLRKESPSAAEKAYWILRERIITHKFPPGSAIRDSELTASLDLGRTPIREALKRLEVESLVASCHRKGTFVNEISLADIKRQYQVYRQLLTLAVALASLSGDEHLKQLDRKYQNCITKAENFELETIFMGVAELDLEFARAAANPYLQRALQQYCGYQRRTWYLLRHALTVDDLQLEDYLNIIEWVIKGNGEESSQLMALHVDAVHLRTVDRFLERFI